MNRWGMLAAWVAVGLAFAPAGWAQRTNNSTFQSFIYRSNALIRIWNIYDPSNSGQELDE